MHHLPHTGLRWYWQRQQSGVSSSAYSGLLRLTLERWRFDEMKAAEFMYWLRDEVGVIRHTKERSKLEKPSNGELRRWLGFGCVQVNGQILKVQDTVEWPITNLVLFPKNAKSRCTLV